MTYFHCCVRIDQCKKTENEIYMSPVEVMGRKNAFKISNI